MNTNNNDNTIYLFMMRMLSILILLFLITIIITRYLYNMDRVRQANITIRNAVDNTVNAIELGTADYLINLTNNVAYIDLSPSIKCITNIDDETIKEFNNNSSVIAHDVDDYLRYYVEAANCREINIIDENGIIIYSNIPEYYGFDMLAGNNEKDQAYDFFTNITKNGYYVQESRGTTYNINNRIRYAGIRLDKDCYLCDAGSYLQVGFGESTINENMERNIATAAEDHSVGKTGKIIIYSHDSIDDGYRIIGETGISAYESIKFNAIENAGFAFNPHVYRADKIYEGEIYGKNSRFMYMTDAGYYVLGFLPVEEIFESDESDILNVVAVEVMIFAVIYAATCILYIVVYNRKNDRKNSNLT